MPDINFELPLKLHEALTAIRGRPVSNDRVSKSYDRHVGRIAEEALMNLVDDVREPWQVQIIWSGPEVERDALHGSRLSWYRTRQEAITAMVRTVDNFRLYPDQVTPLECGGVLLSSVKGPLIRCNPIEYLVLERDLRTECEKAFMCRGQWPRSEVLRFAGKLPGLENLRGPEASTDEAWERSTKHNTDDERGRNIEAPVSTLGDYGLLYLSPATLAQALVDVGTDMKIGLDVAAAKAFVATTLGFDDWRELEESWNALGVFSPYLYENWETGKRVLCRDAIDALAALSMTASELKTPEEYEWSIERAEGGSHHLRFSITRIGDRGARWRIYGHDATKKRLKPLCTIAPLSERGGLYPDMYQGWMAHERPGVFVPRDAILADELGRILGISENGNTRSELTDERSGWKSLDVNGVHITRRASWSGDLVRYEYECLRPSDGWKNFGLEKRRFTPSFDGHHDDGPELRIGERVQLVSNRRRKLETDVDFGKLGNKEIDRLIEFLGMTRTKFGAAYRYEADKRKSLIPEWDSISEEMFPVFQRFFEPFGNRRRAAKKAKRLANLKLVHSLSDSGE